MTEKEYRRQVAAACQMANIQIDMPHTPKSTVCRLNAPPGTAFNMKHRDGLDCFTNTLSPQTWEAAFHAIGTLEKCDWMDQLDTAQPWHSLY